MSQCWFHTSFFNLHIGPCHYHLIKLLEKRTRRKLLNQWIRWLIKGYSQLIWVELFGLPGEVCEMWSFSVSPRDIYKWTVSLSTSLVMLSLRNNRHGQCKNVSCPFHLKRNNKQKHCHILNLDIHVHSTKHRAPSQLQTLWG